jgi:serine/threonine-protein kinase HipA
MTPLYDVMSAQPSVDAGQMRHNKMKLAFAVGKSRHYIIDTIMPRHFIQTGEAAGIPAGLTQGIMSELLAQAPVALEQTWQELPLSFPKDISNAIRNGMLHRLGQIELMKT